VTVQGGQLAGPARKIRIPTQHVRTDSLPQPVVRERRFAQKVVRYGGRLQEAAVLVVTDAVVITVLAVLLDTTLVLVMAGVAAAAWKLRGLYNHRIALSVLDDLPSLVGGVLAALAVAALLSPWVWPEQTYQVALTVVALTALATLGRSLAYTVILRRRAAGRISYPTLLVGAGSATSALSRRIEEHPETGLTLVGALADHHVTRGATSVPLLGGADDLASVVRQRHVTDIVVGYGGTSTAGLVDVLRTCDRVNVAIYVVPRLFELHTLRGGDDHIWGLPLVRIRRPAQRAVTWRLKRAFDVSAAALGLLLTAPLFLAVAAAVRWELGPGLFFRQTRVGLQGRCFELLKFRSMAPDASRGAWTVRGEEFGPVGKFIRRYSLDELPQLINVLRGDMSLVGPRPERPEFVEQFTAAVPRYVHRHRVPAGMTGLAAVNGLRGDTSIEDRAHFDNWYIDNWSLWLDIKIMLRTLTSVLRGTGA
jgi:exopolysaccharide biosynthesis polyprenyl glycosylphosphotransferase